VEALSKKRVAELAIKSWQEYAPSAVQGGGLPASSRAPAGEPARAPVVVSAVG
jgi:hypothetical protein